MRSDPKRWRAAPSAATRGLAAALLFCAAPGWAQEPVPTTVVVRAVAKDAKVIGSGVGGARITIRDLESGEVLAEGVQEGSTGSTPAIMVEPRPRGLTAYGADPKAAGFRATLQLTSPTRVEIIAEGPLGTPDATQRTTKTLWLIPGRDLLGEGVVLELNGLTVELLAPGMDGPVGGDRLPVQARVTMLCGCPTEPGGLWDATAIEVLVRLVVDGRVIRETPLEFSGETSIYGGELPLRDLPGFVELQVIAVDATKGNAGIVRRALTIGS